MVNGYFDKSTTLQFQFSRTAYTCGNQFKIRRVRYDLPKCFGKHGVLAVL
jgi:hypothetical protein